MKQSLEKLHRGIVVPEVQQEATDTLTESLTEAWVWYLYLNIPWLSCKVEIRGRSSCIRTHLILHHFQIKNQVWDKQGNYITSNYLRLTDLKLQPQPVTISVNSFWLDHSNNYLQDVCMYCMGTGHWWASSDHPLLKNHTDLPEWPESF